MCNHANVIYSLLERDMVIFCTLNVFCPWGNLTILYFCNSRLSSSRLDRYRSYYLFFSLSSFFAIFPILYYLPTTTEKARKRKMCKRRRTGYENRFPLIMKSNFDDERANDDMNTLEGNTSQCLTKSGRELYMKFSSSLATTMHIEQGKTHTT